MNSCANRKLSVMLRPLINKGRLGRSNDLSQETIHPIGKNLCYRFINNIGASNRTIIGDSRVMLFLRNQGNKRVIHILENQPLVEKFHHSSGDFISHNAPILLKKFHHSGGDFIPPSHTLCICVHCPRHSHLETSQPRFQFFFSTNEAD